MNVPKYWGNEVLHKGGVLGSVPGEPEVPGNTTSASSRLWRSRTPHDFIN
jgi:hypothetical protein